jgi:hypothetical protein
LQSVTHGKNDEGGSEPYEVITVIAPNNPDPHGFQLVTTPITFYTRIDHEYGAVYYLKDGYFISKEQYLAETQK